MSSADPMISTIAALDARMTALAGALVRSNDAPSPEGCATEGDATRARAIRIDSVRRIWFPQRVPLAALARPGNRIAALEPQDLRRVLAARALWDSRDAVRRCVDGKQRRLWTATVGREAFEALQEQPGACDGDVTLLESATPTTLPWSGWRKVRDDGICANATLGNLVQLSLALGAGGEAWQAMQLPQMPCGDRSDPIELTQPWADGGLPCPIEVGKDTDHFFSIAGTLFPEFQWLFG